MSIKPHFKQVWITQHIYGFALVKGMIGLHIEPNSYCPPVPGTNYISYLQGKRTIYLSTKILKADFNLIYK